MFSSHLTASVASLFTHSEQQKHSQNHDNDTNTQFMLLVDKKQLMICLYIFLCVSVSPYWRYSSPVGGWSLSEHRCNVTGHWIVTKSHTGPAEAVASDVPRKIQIRHSYLVCQHTVFSITKNLTELYKTLHQFLYAKSPPQKIQITL